MKTCICGDFNIWMDNTSDNRVSEFIEIINSHNLENEVQESTSRFGHIQDLIICGKD